MKTKIKIFEGKQLDRNVYMTPDGLLENAFEEFASDVEIMETHVSTMNDMLIVTVIYRRLSK